MGRKWGQKWVNFGVKLGGSKNGQLGSKMGENGSKTGFFAFFWGFWVVLIRRRLEIAVLKLAQKYPQKKKITGGGYGWAKNGTFLIRVCKGRKSTETRFLAFFDRKLRKMAIFGSNWANWGVQLNRGGPKLGGQSDWIGGQIWGC